MILRKQSWIIDTCIGLYSFQDLSINSSSHIQHVHNGNIIVEGQLNLGNNGNDDVIWAYVMYKRDYII